MTFPQKEYKSLPPQPDCALGGSLETFSDCSLSGQTITLKTASDYSSGVITLSVKEVPNPDRGTTDPFLISSFYDGQAIDSTTAGQTLSTKDKADGVTIQSLTFDPRNEAEPATYVLTMVPSSTISTTHQLFVEFPSEYDPFLGQAISCKLNSGLIPTKAFRCSVSDRQVFITGFDSYVSSANNPIVLQIAGVINPNALGSGKETGHFKVGVLKSNLEEFENLNSEAGTV